MAKMQKELSDLRNEVRNKSRTPSDVAIERTQQQWERSENSFHTGNSWPCQRPGQRPLLHPRDKAKGMSKRGNRGGQKKAKDGIWSFDQVSNSSELRNFFTPKNVNKGVCSSFRAIVAKTRTVPGSTVPLVAVDPNRTMNATARKIVSTPCLTERGRSLLLKSRKSQKCLPSAPNSSHESDFLAVLRKATSQRPNLQFELTYLDLSPTLYFSQFSLPSIVCDRVTLQGCTWRSKRARGHAFVTHQLLGNCRSDQDNNRWDFQNYILKIETRSYIPTQRQKCAVGSWSRLANLCSAVMHASRLAIAVSLGLRSSLRRTPYTLRTTERSGLAQGVPLLIFLGIWRAVLVVVCGLPRLWKRFPQGRRHGSRSVFWSRVCYTVTMETSPLSHSFSYSPNDAKAI